MGSFPHYIVLAVDDYPLLTLAVNPPLQIGKQLRNLEGFRMRTVAEYDEQEKFAENRPASRISEVRSRGARKVGERPSTQGGSSKGKEPPCQHGWQCRCSKKEYMDSIGVVTFAHAFSGIPHVHAITIAPRDLMHVELEGTLKSHLYGVLYMAICKLKWFTLSKFNTALKTWPFPNGHRPDGLQEAPTGEPATAFHVRKFLASMCACFFALHICGP